MILGKYQSLGVLPELIVFVFLLPCVIILALLYLKVSATPPVVLVPNAEGIGEAHPAEADEVYARAFADAFLSHYGTWNIYSYAFRRKQAIDLMWPGAQGAYSELNRVGRALVDSLAQSQALTIKSVEASQQTPDIWYLKCSGEVKTWYAGVGGVPEPYLAILLLRKIQPSPTNPMCLEVYGFKQIRGSDASQEKKP